MARGGKKRFTEELRCAKCGRTGGVRFEEIESPPHHPGTTGYAAPEVVSVDEGFRADGVNIYCACGEKVRSA